MLSLVSGFSAKSINPVTPVTDSTEGVKPTFPQAPTFIKDDIQGPDVAGSRPELVLDYSKIRGKESSMDCVGLSQELKSKTWWKRLWWYRGQYLSGEQYFVRTLVVLFSGILRSWLWWAGVVDYSRMKSLGHSNETSLAIAAVSPLATMITLYGYLSDPANPINLPIVIGFLMFIHFIFTCGLPTRRMLWFGGVPKNF